MAELKRDPKNARRHPDANKTAIRKSLEEVGAFRSIAVDGDDVVRAGNGVFEQAQALGLRVRVVEAERDELIAVKRADLRGREAERAALLDNATGESSEWDEAIIADILAADAALLDGLGDSGALAAVMAKIEAGDVIAPDDFKEFDEDIDTEYQCPKCGYRWSGKADAQTE